MGEGKRAARGWGQNGGTTHFLDTLLNLSLRLRLPEQLEQSEGDLHLRSPSLLYCGGGANDLLRRFDAEGFVQRFEVREQEMVVIVVDPQE